MKTRLMVHLRIIWAITLKDLVDAIKNKNVLGVIIPALFMVVLYRYMPQITSEDGPPALLIYDSGNPTVMLLLEDSAAINLYSYESKTQMLHYLSNGQQPEMGLVLSTGLDQAIQSEQPVTLQGYMLHFFTDEQVTELREYMEDELEYLLGIPVAIQVQRIQLQPDTDGITILASMGLGFVILMVGMIAIPHLMLEEKQDHTLEAMLVSPANIHHIIVAKILTCLIYTLIVFGIGLFLFRAEIVNWGLAIVTGFLGSLFSVSLGLLLGILVENRQQLVLWAWVGIIPIFLAMMLSFMDDLLPPWIIQIVRWVPSSALMRALRSAMVAVPPFRYFIPQILILFTSALLVLVIDIWLVRRLDR